LEPNLEILLTVAPAATDYLLFYSRAPAMLFPEYSVYEELVKALVSFPSFEQAV
jgi:hypothetical protein